MEMIFPYSFAFFFFLPLWPCRVACGILVPCPGIEPGSLAVKVQSPNHWTTREVPPLEFQSHFLKVSWYNSLIFPENTHVIAGVPKNFIQVSKFYILLPNR